MNRDYTQSNLQTNGAEQDPTYEMSVILITPDRYETIRGTIQALQQQTIKEKLELVIVRPTCQDLKLIESDLVVFGGYQVVGLEDFASPSVARAAGVQAAQAPVIVFTEDHSFPEKDWAEALVKRHKESWTGVGPMVYNANPGTLLSWTNFLMEYGEWTTPLPGHPLRHIPGHNSSYKRKALLAYGSNLADMLQSESPMQWDMMRKGHRFCIEPRAKTYHLNYSVFWKTFPFRFGSGRLFATRRAQSWPVAQRWLYVLASPLIPLIRTSRVLRTAYRIGQGKRIPQILPIAFILLVMDGFGEMVGYAIGTQKENHETLESEFHRERYLAKHEQQKVTDLTGILSLREGENDA